MIGMIGLINLCRDNRTFHCKKGDATAMACMEAISVDTIEQYYDLLNEVLEKKNLKQPPGQIYKCRRISNGPQTLATKSGHLERAEKVKCRTSGDKSQITVVGCVSAVGQAIPPFVIFKAKTFSPHG